MDGLDEFERKLASEKKARERAEYKQRKSEKRKQGRHYDVGDYEKKRTKHAHDREEQDEELYERHDHSKKSKLHKTSPLHDAETATRQPSVRDSWMTEPSALDFDYTQRGVKKDKINQPLIAEPSLAMHKNELNLQLRDSSQSTIDASQAADVTYEFGDSGSQWRMTKLKAVYTKAKQSGRAVEDIALQQFGDLKEFDAAREEDIELGRREVYGNGYVGKTRPSGDLHKERQLDSGIRRNLTHDETKVQSPRDDISEGTAVNMHESTGRIDQTGLNRMKAQIMRAKLKGSLDIARLEAEYAAAMKDYTTQSGSDVVVLSKMDNRMLAGGRGEVKTIDNKRGRERGMVQDNEDMSIEDMVREERRTKGQAGGDTMRAAERIAKDAKFDNDLDYMDDNANNLARKVHKSDVNLRNAAIGEYQKMNRILDSCMLCAKEDTNQPPVAPMISLATRVYLTIPTEPELSEGGAVIVPIQHRVNLLECDDDEWEEIRNFMKCLTRMYHDQGRDVVFYENAAAPHRKMHAAMQVVPLPYSLGETAPAFFKEAILSADEEWSQHKKLIDTSAKARQGLGKLAFRRSIAKEMPYFHVWFDLEGGLGHIVEDAGRWPRGDLFAREIIGGMLDVEPDVIKRQGRWNRADKRVDGFKKRWKKFDWTRVLTDG